MQDQVFHSRVFISYSSKSAAALAALEALRLELTRAGYTVFIDRWDLKPGERWRPKILFALAECTAGVLLLSQDTLKQPPQGHPWVLFESSILSFRRELDPNFQLIPVLLEGLKPQALEKARFFSPQALAQVQVAQADTPEQLAQKVRQALGDASGRKGQRTLLQRVTEQFQLSLLKVSDNELRLLALQLRNRDFTAWTQDQCRAGIAMSLARMALLEGSAGMKKAIDSLLESLDAERAERFLRLMDPLWVQAERALRLKALPPRPPLPTSVAITSDPIYFEFTAEAHVHRAFWPKLTASPTIVTVNRKREKLVPAVSRSIVQKLRPSVTGTSLAQARKQVEAYLKLEKPVFFVVLPRDWWKPSQEDLEKLHQHYPTAIFLLNTGPDEPKHLPPIFYPFPKIDAAEEQQAFNVLRMHATEQFNKFGRELKFS